MFGPEAEEGGQIVLAAADKSDATTAYNHCYFMAMEKEWPKHILRPRRMMKELEYHPNKSLLKAISTKPENKFSFNVSCALFDEIHAWPAVYARDLYQIIRDSMTKRSNPLCIIISVAPQGQGGLAHDLWTYSLKVARGEIDDPTFAPIIYAADPNVEDWQDEELWHRVNPALPFGLLNIEDLRRKAKESEHFPANVTGFKRYHLNIPAESVAEPWIDLSIYDQQQPRAALDELAGQTCWVGVDLSSTEDLTAVCAVFVEGDEINKSYSILPMFFLPEIALDKKADLDGADYLRWRDQGILRVTDGNCIDKQAVVSYICELAETYDLREVVIDPYRAVDVTVPLQEGGFEVVKFGQGFLPMSAPMAETKRAILSKQFKHGGNPLLRMCFANAVAIEDGHENEKLTKGKSRGRIDGAVASVIAIGRAMQAEPEGTPGFLFVDSQLEFFA